MKTKHDKSYVAIIKVLGKKYEAKGKTAKEAIENLEIGNVAKGVSILTVSRGGNSHSKVLNSSQTFRLFGSSGLMREVAVKQVSLMFDGI